MKIMKKNMQELRANLTKEADMNIGKACAIFEQIESDKYTEQDKLQAIKEVIAMPTHNGITKDEILKAFRWLFNLVTVEENEKQTNFDRIKTMSLEEMTEFLEDVETQGYYDQSVSGTLKMIDWLQSEVEG